MTMTLRDRVFPRGPRRGAGKRTIYVYEEGSTVHLYVRGPGAGAWAKSKGDVLGESWERVTGDFAHASLRRYPGMWKDLKSEYPNVTVHHLEYAPPRSWITSRDSRDPRRLSPQKRTALSRKIRLLRHEGYPQKQAIAIAHRMLKIPKPRRRKKS